jgi:hypothetical protein
MNEDIDLEKYLKNNGWSGRGSSYFREISEYYEYINIWSNCFFTYYKKFQYTSEINNHKDFFSSEDLIKFLKERNND